MNRIQNIIGNIETICIQKQTNKQIAAIGGADWNIISQRVDREDLGRYE